jgi:hypothetical protein
MNTVYFFTDSVQCEELNTSAHCKQYKAILLELLTDNLLIMDLFQNETNLNELTSYLGLSTYTPYIVIKNSENEVVFHFDPLYMRTKVPFGTENYWDAIKTEMQSILTQYGALI